MEKILLIAGTIFMFVAGVFFLTWYESLMSLGAYVLMPISAGMVFLSGYLQRSFLVKGIGIAVLVLAPGMHIVVSNMPLEADYLPDQPLEELSPSKDEGVQDHPSFFQKIPYTGKLTTKRIKI